MFREPLRRNRRRDEREARRHRVLRRVTDAGMTFVEDLEQRALDARGREEPPEAVTHRASAFARIARTVRLTVALDARLDDWAIERERKRRALDAELAAQVKREHIRKAKRRVVMAFRDIVERGADREYLELAEKLMESDGYDEELYELPFTEALAIVANDLGGSVNRTTFG